MGRRRPSSLGSWGRRSAAGRPCATAWTMWLRRAARCVARWCTPRRHSTLLCSEHGPSVYTSCARGHCSALQLSSFSLPTRITHAAANAACSCWSLDGTGVSGHCVFCFLDLLSVIVPGPLWGSRSRPRGHRRSRSRDQQCRIGRRHRDRSDTRSPDAVADHPDRRAVYNSFMTFHSTRTVLQML